MLNREKFQKIMEEELRRAREEQIRENAKRDCDQILVEVESSVFSFQTFFCFEDVLGFFSKIQRKNSLLRAKN